MNVNTVACHPGDSGKALHRLPQLANPRLHFNVQEEAHELLAQESWRNGAERSSKTLVKYSDLRLVLVAMKAGTLIQEHRTEGPVSIHCIRGRLRVAAQNQIVDLPVGDLLALDCAVPHRVEAMEESVFLLTISWPKGERLHE